MKIVKAIGVVMALVLGSSVMASDYTPDPTGKTVDIPVVARHCTEVGKMVMSVSTMFDKGWTDTEIVKTIISVGVKNLGDLDGWVAVNMLGREAVIADMRKWPGTIDYRMVVDAYPGESKDLIMGTLATMRCNTMIGGTYPVIQLVPKKVPGTRM